MTPRRPSHLASFPSLGGTAHAALGVTETTWPPRFLGNPRARLPRSPTPVGPTSGDHLCGSPRNNNERQVHTFGLPEPHGPSLVWGPCGGGHNQRNWFPL